jgi:hypothetical protein
VFIRRESPNSPHTRNDEGSFPNVTLTCKAILHYCNEKILNDKKLRFYVLHGSRELSDNKNRAASHHLTKASHEPPQLNQCPHSFQNPHMCKADFLNLTRESVSEVII